jgi:hypothetical protein
MAKIASTQTTKNPKTMKALMWGEISSSLADRLFAISNVVLVLGAAAVLVGTIGAIIMSGVREQFANERISANETATAQARADSDLANARAAEANRAAEQERLARVKLEAKLAPRSLTTDQMVELRNKWLQYAGATVDILIFPSGTPDIMPLAGIIRETLIQSQWIIEHNWQSLGGFVVGVGVAVRSGSNPLIEKQADILVEGLNAADVLTSRAPPLKDDSMPVGAVGDSFSGVAAPIRIYIGTKP